MNELTCSDTSTLRGGVGGLGWGGLLGGWGGVGS